jgi:hypothetical protein
MKQEERSRAVIAALEAQRDKLVAWLRKPAAERAADVEKVLHVTDTQGVVAGRRMMAALGLPTIPDELCDPPNLLEVHHAQGRTKLNEAGRLRLTEYLSH